MKIKVLVSILGLAVAGNVSARQLTPAEALSRVENSGVKRVKSTGGAPSLITVKYDKTGNPAIYVYTYSGNEGCMLVSADDAGTPLLGYSETNRFSTDNMPDNLASWLEYYSDEIENARGGVPYTVIKTRAGEKAEIKPMVTSQWDQMDPYNSECPTLNGRACVTGCVATAMAQVMNYWQYPQTGKGSNTYTPAALGQQLSMDFSKVTFDWGHMRDTYPRNGYSATEKHAVATLMKACGYSVSMNYTNWESGAYSKNIMGALTNNFGYDQGVRQVLRSGYSSQDEWNDMIYNELATTGPVIYGGQSTSGGHSFVCDGYDGNGYFHINWGWSGMSDGYFLLNELTPNEVGTGGHYGGYNLQQDAIVGIMPPVGRLTVEKIYIDNAADDSGNVKEWGYTYRIMNPSNISLAVDLTIKGGHVSAPLYYTIYDTDPATKKNKEVVLESTFDKPVNASDGKVTCSTSIRMNNFDPSKLYTLNVAYELKGKRETLGSIRMAASSGVDDITYGDGINLCLDGNVLKAECESAVSLSLYDVNGLLVGLSEGANPQINIAAIAPGVYIARAKSADGGLKTLKLHLK